MRQISSMTFLSAQFSEKETTSILAPVDRKLEGTIPCMYAIYVLPVVGYRSMGALLRAYV